VPRGKRTTDRKAPLALGRRLWRPSAPRLTAAEIHYLALKYGGYFSNIPAWRFSRDDALSLLQEFVLHAKESPRLREPLHTLLVYVYVAVQARLEGKVTTIDQGLGLIQPKRGGRKASVAILEHRLRLAREVATLIDSEGMSKDAAADKVDKLHKANPVGSIAKANPNRWQRILRPKSKKRWTAAGDAYDDLKFLARLLNSRDTRNKR
jgi:hypothetical protein